jgi:hypothetical protein
MSQEARHAEVRQKTQHLLHGSLKHVRAAGLAAALIPLAVVAVRTADGQFCSSSGIVCGVVWNDVNNNGIQDAGEPVIENAVVTLGESTKATDLNGYYEFVVKPGTYEIVVQIPPGMQPSPSNVGTSDTLDSDGITDGIGNVIGPATLVSSTIFNSSTDFGFSIPSVNPPGTGTPGYWKNHPEAWPVQTVTVGGVSYTKAQAIVARRGRQGQDHYDVQLARFREVERDQRHRQQLHRQHDRRRRRLDGGVRTRGQRRACGQPRLEAGRTAASSSGQLQQRNAVRSTP